MGLKMGLDKRTVLPAAAAMLMAAGCSIQKGLEETKDRTARMEETTRDLRDLTTTVYTSARSALGVAMSKESMAKLLATGDGEEMMGYAISFFGTLPFQEWQGQGHDTQEVRDELFLTAINLYFASIQNLVDDKHPVSVIIPSKNWMRLSTLSVGMSYISDDQKYLARQRGFQPRSMYDLLTEALLQKRNFESGKDTPKWVIAVLRNEDTATYLLQLRHNYLGYVVAGRMSALEDKKLGLPFNYILQTTIKSWKVHLDTMGLAQTELILEWLDKIEHTRGILNAIGEEPRYNKSVQRLMRNLVWVSAEPGRHLSLRERMKKVFGVDPSVRPAKSPSSRELPEAPAGLQGA
jgi:hypothetical protein